MRQLLATGCALALAVGAGGCRGSDDPYDYSGLTRMAERLPEQVGTPPGIGDVEAAGGSMGDAGYFQITVTLTSDATADDVVTLLDEELPTAMGKVGGMAGAPLVVRSSDGDEMRPRWGEHDDPQAERSGIQDWLAAARDVPEPVRATVGDDERSFAVDLGSAPLGAVVETLRRFVGHGGDWGELRVSSGSPDAGSLFYGHFTVIDAALLSDLGEVFGGARPAGPFRPLSLDIEAQGSLLTACTYTFIAPQRIPDADITVAAYGDVLLPALAEQAAGCGREQLHVYAAHRDGTEPVALLETSDAADETRTGEWSRALRTVA